MSYLTEPLRFPLPPSLDARRAFFGGNGDGGTCRGLMLCARRRLYLLQEEEGALPLIKHYFTGQEMQALVGKIMGKRPTELMQAKT